MSKLLNFVDRMVYWCQTSNLGYDQSNRWDIRDGGEADCSSLVYWCLWEAGLLTKPADYKTRTLYTGTLKNDLIKAGWVAVKPDGKPKKGDILLNEKCHVGVWTGSKVAQASIDENGNIKGGKAGDQTGRETCLVNYYNYPWDCYMRLVDNTKRLILYPSNGGKNQKFKLVPVDGKWCRIESIAYPNMSLDIEGGRAYNGANVILWENHGQENQLWCIEGEFDEPCRIKSALGDFYLDATGNSDKDNTPICVWQKSGTMSQDFFVLEESTDTYCFLNNNTGRKLMLDVCGG